MKTDLKKRLALYKNNGILFISVFTITAVFLIVTFSSCCIDLNKLLEPKS